jgi:ATP-binding cassette subfamily C (CFTR/MRP) protein 1
VIIYINEGLLHANISEVKRVPYADHIVVLNDEGRISEQGYFKNLTTDGGYISSFNLAPPEWSYGIQHETRSATSKQFLNLPDDMQSSHPSESSASRRVGDFSVYLYYVKAVGVIPTLFFVIAISAFVFCFSFPSTSPLPFCWGCFPF